MKIYQFKTNINCSGCVAKITPHLDSTEGIVDWKVETNNIDKLLTVKTNLGDEEVKKIVETLGFKAEIL
jgi:copper chaperone